MPTNHLAAGGGAKLLQTLWQMQLVLPLLLLLLLPLHLHPPPPLLLLPLLLIRRVAPLDSRDSENLHLLQLQLKAQVLMLLRLMPVLYPSGREGLGVAQDQALLCWPVWRVCLDLVPVLVLGLLEVRLMLAQVQFTVPRIQLVEATTDIYLLTYLLICFHGNPSVLELNSM